MKSSFDLLLEYAKKNSYEYETHKSERKFIVSTNDRIHNTKYLGFEKESLIFLAYDSYGTKAFMSQTFTGVYKIYPNSSETDLSIFKREWIDNILRRKREKTNNKKADRNLTVICKKGHINLNSINTDFVRNYLSLSKIISPIELLIKPNYLDFLNSYINKNIIGVETNQWVYDHREIDSLIEQGEILIDQIISKS